MPDVLFLRLESAINDSNSDNDREEVERSSTMPFLNNSIHSLSSIDRCLAVLLPLDEMNISISSNRSLSSSNSRSIATLRAISSSPLIDASRANKDSIRELAVVYLFSSRFNHEIVLRGSSESLLLQISIANPLSSQEPIISIPSSSNSRHSWSSESTKSTNSSVMSSLPTRALSVHLSGQRVAKSFHLSRALR